MIALQVVHPVSQDLSIAGLRKGLKHEEMGDEETTRSGLFMEQIRIVKEMRHESERQLQMRGTNYYRGDIKPRFMVWENVYGAFSSNGGKDFQAVLTEIVRIIEPEAPDVPLPKNGRWEHAGELHDEMGRWSIAYRGIDSQFFGTPQRRKRIALVADFASGGAADILFEQYLGDEPRSQVQSQSEGLCRDSEPSRETREDTSTTVGGSPSETIGGGTISFQERAGKEGGGKGILIQNERTGTLSTLNNQSVFTLNGKDVTPPLDAHYGFGAGARAGVEREAVMVYGISALDSNAMKSPNPHSGIYEADTARTLDRQGDSPACNQGGMIVLEENDKKDICYSQERFDKYEENDKSPALLHTGGSYGGGSETLIVSRNEEGQHLPYQDIVGTLCSRDMKGVGNEYVDEGKCIIQRIGNRKSSE